MNTLDILIPAPLKSLPAEGRLPIALLKRRFVDGRFASLASDLDAAFVHFGLGVDAADTASDAQVVLASDESLAAEAFRLEVAPSAVRLSASDRCGARYAVSALRQMLFGALACGYPKAALDCGTVEDAPRFGYRGFMLDSARHFQPPAVVRQFLRLLSEFRVNVFHWHLVDSQGWRIQLPCTQGLETLSTFSGGFYTDDDIREITALADALGIEIIPEIEMPGHSSGLLARFPQFACRDAVHRAGEICLGNPEAMAFLKRVLAETMAHFPKSRRIHLGGDEADTTNWEHCPRCREAMAARGLKTMRELENAFMVEMTRFAVAQGWTPTLWGTCSEQRYPADTTIQAWLDIREPIRLAQNGNKVVYSVNTSLYFDQPANLNEPWQSWMFALPEEAVYMTDPHIIWPEKVKDAILGTEACLWTETIPPWRVLQKLLPRLYAYAECAWSAPARKDFNLFRARHEFLTAAGHDIFLLQHVQQP